MLQAANKLVGGLAASQMLSQTSGRLERPTYQKPGAAVAQNLPVVVPEPKRRGNRRKADGETDPKKKDKETLVNNVPNQQFSIKC